MQFSLRGIFLASLLLAAPALAGRKGGGGGGGGGDADGAGSKLEVLGLASVVGLGVAVGGVVGLL
ncbi:hypothetical protein CC1G_07790 [Coprinopsis cinerea okayama7|uniref:Uncharacterized protein n=1 Tax=Coprinopsis cinerea (strain Okayama-7 / 130 / ATCC MYA-4618 / FGSC 9003) TaxID=240176 RepID=A8NP21_COPC7|nr:hypothetical protein CC1G_07790 [Coprinopsis cinerea okayama7\|eukprot:XP_001835247.1 hypothetical protein CC1G_07790 [Coprinopsis cinerea okayama7\